MGEDIAVKYLEKNGYVVLKRNFYCRQGEIDIVAKQDNEIVFVEVKTRTNVNYGVPSDAINFIKLAHMVKSAKYFLYINDLLNSCIRFDVVEVLLFNGKFNVRHIKQVI